MLRTYASRRDDLAVEKIFVHLEQLNLGIFPLLLGVIGYQAVGNFGAQLLFDLTEGRWLGNSPVQGRNDMITELGASGSENSLSSNLIPASAPLADNSLISISWLRELLGR